MSTETVPTDEVAYGEQYRYGDGLGVWLDRSGCYRIDGRYGQYAVISPAKGRSSLSRRTLNATPTCSARLSAWPRTRS